MCSPSRGMPRTSEALCLIQTQSPVVSQRAVTGTVFQCWCPGWEARCGAGTFCSPGGPPQLRYSSLFLMAHCGRRTCLAMSPPLLPVLLCPSLDPSYRTCVQLVQLVPNDGGSIILMQSREEASTAFTYSAILTGNCVFPCVGAFVSLCLCSAHLDFQG